MEMQGSRELAITQQQAWEALNDPEVLKQCIPGCDKVESTGPDAYSIGMALKIGPVSAKFTGKITLSDINPPQSYTISFEGQGGPAGHGKGSAKVQLTPTGKGHTLSYLVQASVGGKVAQLGQRLIDGAAKSLAEDFFKRFETALQEKYPESAPTQSLGAPEQGASTESDIAKAKRAKIFGWLWPVVAGVVGGVAVWWFRR
jgi:carbon monoxide dehydrogenase subunit G